MRFGGVWTQFATATVNLRSRSIFIEFSAFDHRCTINSCYYMVLEALGLYTGNRNLILYYMKGLESFQTNSKWSAIWQRTRYQASRAQCAIWQGSVKEAYLTMLTVSNNAVKEVQLQYVNPSHISSLRIFTFCWFANPRWNLLILPRMEASSLLR